MKSLVLAAAVIVATALPAAAASVIVGTSNGTIGTLDTNTGNISGAYDAGPAWFDIAVDNNGSVFGTNGNTLYFIDVDNSAAGVSLGSHSFVNGLAFDSTNVLYGAGGGTLYTLDTNTGASTVVGSIGSGYSSSGDLAYAGSDRFFGTSAGGCQGGGDCLFSIDANTGVGNYIGDIGFNNVYGLALIEGTLFGMTAADQLIAINTTTGAGSLVTGYLISGSTYGGAVPGSAAEVNPVPLPAGLPLLLSALGFFGFMGWRRKQTVAA